MIFVELLVVEVHHLEIVIGRFQAASRCDRVVWGLCKICPKKNPLLGHKYDFESLLTSLVGQNLSLDAQVV